MISSSLHGLLVLDKPAGMTSRAALDRAARWLPDGCRIGHTGTLDPLATGVLVLCVGVATRLVEYVQRMSKTYRAGLLLGAQSDSDDADGTITAVEISAPPGRDEVDNCLRGFIGGIAQVPPVYSAAKVAGRRAYALARRGDNVELEPRLVRIDAITVMDYAYPQLEIEVKCGKGTYVRSLARDVGQRLGCGALVRTLRRLRVGPFDVADALSLEMDAVTARSRLLPLAAAVAELPALTLGAHDIERLNHGQTIDCRPDFPWSAAPADAREVAILDANQRLTGIVVTEQSATRLKPVKMLRGA